MLQQLLMWYIKTVAKATVWFIKELGPAMAVAFIPTFAVGTVATLLFGSNTGGLTGGYLMNAPELTQDLIGASFLVATALVYLLGWQILWDIPKTVVVILSEVAGDVRAYIQR